MDKGLGRPFWRDIPGLGDWIRLVDVCRASGVKANSSHRLNRFLRSRGCELRLVGNAWYCRRSEMPAFRDFYSEVIQNFLLRSGPRATEAFALLDRPEFEEMELPDIFDALAEDFAATLAAIPSKGGE